MILPLFRKAELKPEQARFQHAARALESVACRPAAIQPGEHRWMNRVGNRVGTQFETFFHQPLISIRAAPLPKQCASAANARTLLLPASRSDRASEASNIAFGTAFAASVRVWAGADIGFCSGCDCGFGWLLLALRKRLSDASKKWGR